MMHIRLTYFSRHRLGHLYGGVHSGIADILAISSANNLRDGITGALICDDRWLAQVLEGAESTVSATFERILRDQRHCDVTLVTMQPVSERLYPDFAMACVFHCKDNSDLFRHYGEDERFNPREMRAERLSDLIEAVMERGPTGGQTWTTRSTTTAA